MIDTEDTLILEENVQDWLYTNGSQSCFKSDNEYVCYIRGVYANSDIVADKCTEDLIDIYHMLPDEVYSHKELIKESLSKEAKLMFDSFSYSDEDSYKEEDYD